LGHQLKNSQLLSLFNLQKNKTAMKTIVKTIACALALSTSVAFATTDKTTTDQKPVKFEVGAYVAKDETIRVAINKNTATRLKVSLKNANGQVLYSQIMGRNESNFATKLNIDDLGAGIYKLEVSDGTEKIVKELNVKSAAVARTVSLQ
jgi:hypothetical protein